MIGFVSPYLNRPLDLDYREALEKRIAEVASELAAAKSDTARREIGFRLRLLRLELRLAPHRDGAEG